MKNYKQLKNIFKKHSHLEYIQRILMWDEATMMPAGAGQSRAGALATLNSTMQKMLTKKKMKDLIANAKAEDLSSWDKSNLIWMEKLYTRATCIPPKLIEEATKAAVASEQAWRKFRVSNNWYDFSPYLEVTFKYVKEIAQRQSQVVHLHPYDVLLDDFAPGFNQKTIDGIFSPLKDTLLSLVKEIRNKQKDREIKIPKGPFVKDKQKIVGLKVMKSLGFDFEYGRLDVSHHPFCSGGPTDVRVTTRYSEDEFLTSLLAICHETGHALYEQGLPRKWITQPVGKVNSMAMHESQSLLIEMEVCHMFAFYEYLLPLVTAEFGLQEPFTAKNLYRLATKVEPGLIRVNADEVTYPLHIILRYELEKALLNNEITISELPFYWDELMSNYLDISTKGNDKDGVMQDVHWPAGLFGYFPAYTLGRLIAAQLFNAYMKANPQYENDIRKGEFHSVRNWLKENVYKHASSLPTNDLLIEVTGKPLSSDYYLERIKARYS